MRTEAHAHVRRRVGEGERGFTLVEAMVVVAIIGIVATLGFLALDSGSRGRDLEGFADRLAAEYTMARQRAIATQKRQRLVIESNGFSHWQSVQTGLAEVSDPGDPANWDFVASQNTAADVVIASVDATLHLDAGDTVPGFGVGLPIEIDVLPDGRARTAGAGTFIETGWTFFLQDDKKQARILLFGITGAASVFNDW